MTAASSVYGSGSNLAEMNAPLSMASNLQPISSNGIVNLTRSSRPSWPLSLERGQAYRRAKDFSAPNAAPPTAGGYHLLGTGHGDIKQTALFLDLRRIAGGHVRGDSITMGSPSMTISPGAFFSAATRSSWVLTSMLVLRCHHMTGRLPEWEYQILIFSTSSSEISSERRS
jgi:hypothetical protein